MARIRRALLVGIERYADAEIADLCAVPQDIETIAAVLAADEVCGFESIEQETGSEGEVTAEAIRIAIERFFTESTGTGVNLVYIGSHARVDPHGVLHILPSDYDPTLPSASAVSIQFIGSCLVHCLDSPVILILDCCYADAGAWQIVDAQNRILALPKHVRPNFCVIASTRQEDPAIDGGFAPVFAEALTGLEPAEGEEAVDIQRAFQYLSKLLDERHYQIPRMWQSSSVPMPVGRRFAGLRASKKAVEDLYEFIEDRTLEAPDSAASDKLDLIEIYRSPQSFRIRTGLRILEGESSREEIRQVVEDLTVVVEDDTIDNGIAIVTEDGPGTGFDTDRVVVRSFESFRRELLPLIRYLEDAIKNYETDEDGIYRKGCYVSVYAKQERAAEHFVLDKHLLEKAADTATISTLIVLGEFGAGKTTTAKQVFWRQSKRYLERPATARLPIFVNLKEFDRAFDMETLIERSISMHRQEHGLSFQMVQRLNEEGRIFWILDGFDEMAVRVTDQVMHDNFAEILKLATPQVRILLTCRTAFFKSNQEAHGVLRGTKLHDLLRKDAEAIYEILFVQPFREEDIEVFVRARIKQAPDEFLDKVRSTPEIRGLASRPILLEMIVFSLPNMVEKGIELNLSNLYEDYTEALLRRDQWRVVMAKVEDRIGFCQHLAWYFFANEKYEITYKELPGFIKEYFPEKARKLEEFEALERAIRTTSFLSRDDEGNFSFVHKSFLEFFAASYIVRFFQSDPERVIGYKIIPKEILRFLGEMIGENEEAEKNLIDLATSTKPSLSYFLGRYLKPRLFPVLRKSRITSHVQRRSSHRWQHLIFPAVLTIALMMPVTNYVDDQTALSQSPSVLFLTILTSSLLATAMVILVYSATYLWRIRSGNVGDPIQRFNTIAAGYFATREEIEPNTLNRLLSEVPPEQGATAAIVSDSILGIESTGSETEASNPRESPSHNAFTGPPTRVAAWLATLAAFFGAAHRVWSLDLDFDAWEQLLGHSPDFWLLSHPWIDGLLAGVWFFWLVRSDGPALPLWKKARAGAPYKKRGRITALPNVLLTSALVLVISLFPFAISDFLSGETFVSTKDFISILVHNSILTVLFSLIVFVGFSLIARVAGAFGWFGWARDCLIYLASCTILTLAVFFFGYPHPSFGAVFLGLPVILILSQIHALSDLARTARLRTPSPMQSPT